MRQRSGDLLARESLPRTQAADDPLDIDRRHGGSCAALEEREDTLDGRPTAQVVDRHHGVEDVDHGSAGPAWGDLPVFSHPPRRVVVPLVRLSVRQGTGRRARGRSAPGLLQRAEHGSTNEYAAFAQAGEPVDFTHDLVVELYPHSHVAATRRAITFGTGSRSDVMIGDGLGIG